MAGREVLLRRAYCDLIGLPPAPDEVREFLADSDPLAYERLVDRLLERRRVAREIDRVILGRLVRRIVAAAREHEKKKPKP